MNERNHGITDKIWKKAMSMDLKLTQQHAVDLASWVHNMNMNQLGFLHMHLLIGKVTSLPGFTEGTRVTDTNTANETINRLLRTKQDAIIEFRKRNFTDKINAYVKQT